MFESEIQAGAEALDRHVPGWRERLDRSQLDIASTSMCVTAQTFRAEFVRSLESDTGKYACTPWSFGVSLLAAKEGVDAEWGTDSHHRFSADHGFSVDDGDEEVMEEFNHDIVEAQDRLTDEWRHYLSS